MNIIVSQTSKTQLQRNIIIYIVVSDKFFILNVIKLYLIACFVLYKTEKLCRYLSLVEVCLTLQEYVLRYVSYWGISTPKMFFVNSSMIAHPTLVRFCIIIYTYVGLIAFVIQARTSTKMFWIWTLASVPCVRNASVTDGATTSKTAASTCNSTRLIFIILIWTVWT